jgi:hypothetical protein
MGTCSIPEGAGEVGRSERSGGRADRPGSTRPGVGAASAHGAEEGLGAPRGASPLQPHGQGASIAVLGP